LHDDAPLVIVAAVHANLLPETQTIMAVVSNRQVALMLGNAVGKESPLLALMEQKLPASDRKPIIQLYKALQKDFEETMMALQQVENINEDEIWDELTSVSVPSGFNADLLDRVEMSAIHELQIEPFLNEGEAASAGEEGE
jgi:hypothetical protein